MGIINHKIGNGLYAEEDYSCLLDLDMVTLPYISLLLHINSTATTMYEHTYPYLAQLILTHNSTGYHIGRYYDIITNFSRAHMRKRPYTFSVIDYHNNIIIFPLAIIYSYRIVYEQQPLDLIPTIAKIYLWLLLENLPIETKRPVGKKYDFEAVNQPNELPITNGPKYPLYYYTNLMPRQGSFIIPSSTI